MHEDIHHLLSKFLSSRFEISIIHVGKLAVCSANPMARSRIAELPNVNITGMPMGSHKKTQKAILL